MNRDHQGYRAHQDIVGQQVMLVRQAQKEIKGKKEHLAKKVTLDHLVHTVHPVHLVHLVHQVHQARLTVKARMVNVVYLALR